MASSFAYSPTPVSALTEAQLTELHSELLRELLRLMGRLDVRAQTRIDLILDALRRVRAGTYGACLVCRSPIPYERLAVIPETKACVDCGRDRALQHDA
jgi:RNA polymerase-binding transcription factor DksA